jgi:hypothetical protein
VEAVPTTQHWEAYYLPRNGFAIARGWYRQLDLARNPLLYRRAIPADAYRIWLRSLGVRYVLVPHAHLDVLGAAAEADLLRSGRSGLVPVFRSRDWHIYELPQPTPILTGPGPASLTEVTPGQVAGTASAPGRYLLRIRYTAYLRVARGAVCLAAAPGGMTSLFAQAAGRFLLSVPETPTALVESVVDGGDQKRLRARGRSCRGRSP